MVASGANIIFDLTDPDPTIEVLDVAGVDIEIDDTGTIFTLKRAGLYHLEWSLNLESGIEPVFIGLFEAGNEISVMSNTARSGNHASGALVQVTDADLPYEISLRNIGGEIAISENASTSHTAVSMRILRFADGPTVP